MSRVDVNPNPALSDEPPRINRTDVAATRTLGRGSTYALWIVLGLAVLVAIFAYFAARQAGFVGGSGNNSAVVDTNSPNQRTGASSSTYGATGTGASTGASSGTTTDSRVSGSTGGVTNGGVPSTGSQVGTTSNATGNGDSLGSAGSANTAGSSGASGTGGASSAVGGGTASGFSGR